ncbi:DUF6366 family protein [Brevibacillus sp. NRS-1366]|uniref:DUF6366 family protein n=1 Tax=Brevibacillus sp. NRS-1366 TaxID=3233899 RepID=UPI003D2232D5
MNNDDDDKRRKEEYKKNPYSNLKDSFDRAQFGDLRPLSRLGLIPTIILVVVGIVLLWLVE